VIWLIVMGIARQYAVKALWAVAIVGVAGFYWWAQISAMLRYLGW
jgi:hypothetical protein